MNLPPQWLDFPHFFWFSPKNDEETNEVYVLTDVVSEAVEASTVTFNLFLWSVSLRFF